jgi:hypothetical protein
VVLGVAHQYILRRTRRADLDRLGRSGEVAVRRHAGYVIGNVQRHDSYCRRIRGDCEQTGIGSVAPQAWVTVNTKR